ncbi:hypothetical protein [Cytobacillus firmus]|uniref:hypothetical protein n=1 Tax=Cytobacillus firmus TaxID=1399 RepID=UPI0018CED7E8|nr:hypothetical protein [Cytobacillus firmus]MBG9548361.1 hypothetical protein [Cytobacillus firmus]MBG9600789.1 hypothetical protein [Cytobacillus firmus]MED1938958.1 hypothetical protein [Cytobacillus firmus]
MPTANPLVIRRRLPDGSFGDPVKPFGGETEQEKIARLEREKSELEETLLNTMDATATLFEENLSLQQSLSDNMDATALLFEELLALKGEL